jgi:hypothetical protein
VFVSFFQQADLPFDPHGQAGAPGQCGGQAAEEARQCAAGDRVVRDASGGVRGLPQGYRQRTA